MKIFSRFSQDERGIGTMGVALVVVAITLLGLSAVGLLQAPQIGTQAGAGAGAGGFQPTPAPVYAPAAPGVLSGSDDATRAAMDTANKQQTQAAQWTLTLTDPWAGATVTDNGVAIYEPKVRPEQANAPVYDTGTPGTQNTNNRVFAGGYYTVIYRHSANTYYPVSLCDPEGSKYATPCKIPVNPQPGVQRPAWDFSWNVRRVGAITDPVEENSATDARNVNWANGQSNVTVVVGGDPSTTRCVTVSGTDGRGGARNDPASATGNDFTPTDGDIVWFNDTSCSGSFYIETLWQCGTTANRWCNMPTVSPRFNTNNQSGNEFSSVTLTHLSGDIQSPLTQVSDHFNSNTRHIPFYTTGSEWKGSAARSYDRWQFDYTAANVADGECWDMRYDDNGGYLEWLINQTTVGSAAQTVTFCQYSA